MWCQGFQFAYSIVRVLETHNVFVSYGVPHIRRNLWWGWRHASSYCLHKTTYVWIWHADFCGYSVRTTRFTWLPDPWIRVMSTASRAKFYPLSVHVGAWPSPEQAGSCVNWIALSSTGAQGYVQHPCRRLKHMLRDKESTSCNPHQICPLIWVSWYETNLHMFHMQSNVGE